TERGVVGVAAGGVDRQLVEAGDLGQDGHVDFRVELVDRVATFSGGAGHGRVVTRLTQGVRRVQALFATVLVAHREAEVTGRQREQRAAQVGVVGGGGRFGNRVLAREQEVDDVRIVQRVGDLATAG